MKISISKQISEKTQNQEISSGQIKKFGKIS
jgi:hypothetical protein